MYIFRERLNGTRGRGKGRESQAGFPLSVEPAAGLYATTLRLEQKSGVGYSPD